MSQEKILVIDDEEDILELVRFNLERENYNVLTAISGEEGFALARSKMPDLVILDLMLPGINGLEVFRRLKDTNETNHIKVIMLTAKGEEADIVIGLEMGADDYITKPFSPRVLLARIKAALRSKEVPPIAEMDIIHMYNMVIHPGKREVLIDNKPVSLTFTEFEILCLLANKSGWVFTRNQIMDAIRGEDYFVTDRSVDVQIVGLRKKLGSAGKNIETIRGVGYRFKG
jgi:two-component system phosphate regulon response regulator PhoB